MGGDLPPEKLLQSINATAPLLSPDDTLVILCTEDVAAQCSHLSAEIVTATQVITHNDHPLESIRKKNDSTMIKGIQLVADKKVDAIISLGNTGALFAAASILIKKTSKTHRPGLFTILPSQKNPLGVIDVGGRITANADYLFHCAQIGAKAMRALFGIPKPRVGLLNIGEESLKGTVELKKAYKLLMEASGHDWTFSGNIEGRAVFTGDIDVLVTDGFTGNILLKIAEGITQFVLEEVTPVLPADKLKHLQSRLDYREYPGAILCGVDGLVIKCHGNTGPEGLTKAILEAKRLISNRFIESLLND
jgi:glycerol-3-phosphate acyltransferase PlsX